MRSIFITGATGFVGNKLALRLAEEGNQVHALVRSPKKAELLEHPNIRTFTGDVRDQESIENAMSGCTQAYHVAAAVSLWSKVRGELDQANVGGTRIVLDTALKYNLEKVVFTSSSTVLPLSNGTPVAETAGITTPAITGYGRSKQKAERLINHYLRRHLDVVVVEPTRIYGPGLNTQSTAINNIIASGVAGRPVLMPDRGRPIANWAFIDDVVEGHIQAMAAGKSGRRYILGGDNASFSEFIHILKQQVARSFIVINVPRAVLHLFGEASLILAELTGLKPRMTPEFVKRLLSHSARDISLAIKDLNYQPTPLTNGVSKTIDWITKKRTS